MPNPEPIPGVRVITEHRSSANPNLPSIHISCFAHDRCRMQSDGPAIGGYTIERRDLARHYRIDNRLRQYRAVPILNLLSERERERFQRSGNYWRKQSALPEPPADAPEHRIEFLYQPTGEEKTLFGCTARRWITTQRTQRQPPHHQSESITDAWYLDPTELAQLYPGFSEKLVHHAITFAHSGNERVVFDHQGERPSGLLAESQSTTRTHASLPYGRTSEREHTQQTRILSITPETFSPDFFEPPRNYRQMPVYPTRINLLLERLRSLLSSKRPTPAGYTA